MGYLAIVVFCAVGTPESECDLWHVFQQVERPDIYHATLDDCIKWTTRYAIQVRDDLPLRIYCFKAEFPQNAHSEFMP